MESMTGLFSARAFSNASGPHENQSTGLWACWSKYGLVSWMRRLVCCPLMINLSALQSLCAFSEGSRLVADPMCVHKYCALFQRSLKVLSGWQTALSIYTCVERHAPRVTFGILPLYYCRGV